MIYYPFFREYKTPILSPITGEIIGRRKVRLYVLSNADQTKIIKEVSFCAVLVGKVNKEGRQYKGFTHYTDTLYFSYSRIVQLHRFYEESPNLCPMCKEGFLVKQRQGKYGCTVCEA